MTHEEADAIADVLNLVEDGRRQSVVLLAMISTLLGMLRAKSVLSTEEVRDMEAFIQGSLPFDCLDAGRPMIELLREASEVVLKSSRLA